MLPSCWSQEIDSINTIAVIASSGGTVSLRNVYCNQAYTCLGTADLGTLLSKKQLSKGTELCGNSAAWKWLWSYLEMKDSLHQPEKYLSQRILQEQKITIIEDWEKKKKKIVKSLFSITAVHLPMRTVDCVYCPPQWLTTAGDGCERALFTAQAPLPSDSCVKTTISFKIPEATEDNPQHDRSHGQRFTATAIETCAERVIKINVGVRLPLGL